MKKLAEHLDEVANKKVLVRCNFDVPIDKGQVMDTTRIEDAVSTITTLRKHNSSVILIAHYDRPEGKPNQDKSLKPIVPVLSELVGEAISFAEYKSDISQLEFHSDNKITLVENIRFWAQEESNDQAFAKSLASFADIYVNQAFAVCHREHASVVSIPRHLPSFAGINLANEVEILHRVKNNPDQPLVVIIGGAKLETKEPLVTAFADTAEKILVGGKISKDLEEKGPVPKNVELARLSKSGRDIDESSAKKFADIINNAKTVIWNGPMGVFEEPENAQGTRIVAEAVNDCPAYTIIGGGDTETALTNFDLEEGIDFISTGGGAMLTYLSEGSLVGLDVLNS